MKTRELILIILTFATLALSYLIITESGDRDRLKQVEIDYLKKENLKQKDSLEKQLTLTRDSLSIAFETIKQANIERQAAHERTQKTIRNYESILYIKYDSDTARISALKKLYPSWR